MAKYIYEVSLQRGRSNPEFHKFLENVMALNAKAPDYGGINNFCLIGHHMDVNTIRFLCAEGLKRSKTDLSTVEVTKTTLQSTNVACTDATQSLSKTTFSRSTSIRMSNDNGCMFAQGYSRKGLGDPDKKLLASASSAQNVEPRHRR